MAHTYAILEVSYPTYQEIYALLRSADYGHAIRAASDGEVIDMDGIALRLKKTFVDELSWSTGSNPPS